MRRQPRIDWGAVLLTVVPLIAVIIGVACLVVLILAGLFGTGPAA